MNNTTNNTNNTTSASTVNTLKPMIPALKSMRRNNNVRAISKDYAFATGVPEASFKAWRALVEKSLYEVSVEYGKKFNNKNATDEELTEAENAVYAVWRTVCEVGQEGHQALFIRPADASKIAHYSIKFGSSLKGTVETAVDPKDFRRCVEAMLGIRMAQNAVLSTPDYVVLETYDKAEVLLAKTETRLNGGERNGKAVKGLLEELTEAETRRDDMKTMIAGLGIDDNKAEELLTPYQDKVDAINDSIKKANKTIDGCKETMKKQEKAYTAVLAKIAEIA